MKDSERTAVDLDRLAATGAPVKTGAESIAEAGRDRGRFSASQPQAVVSPRSAREVAAVVQLAAEEGWPLAIRGLGTTCGGQSLAGAPLVLDTGLMSSMGEPSGDTCWVDAGSSWSDVSQTLGARGRLALPLPRRGSVGGGTAVSALGLGCQRTAVAERVLAVEVVTGRGEAVTCSEGENRDLFDLVRGGLGQFAVITRVRLQTRETGQTLVRRIHVYPDVAGLLEALATLGGGDALHVEGRCVPALLGRGAVAGSAVPVVSWQFAAEAVFEAGSCQQEVATEAVDTDELTLQDWLQPPPWLMPQPEVPGAAGGVQPWMDWFVPTEMGIKFVEGLLAGVPGELFVGGRLLLQLRRRDALPLLMQPAGDTVLRVGLHCGIPKASAAALLPLFARVAEVARAAGATMHPAGWLGLQPYDWQQHFSSRWQELCSAKRFYDPAGILNPGMIPAGGGS